MIGVIHIHTVFTGVLVNAVEVEVELCIRMPVKANSGFSKVIFTRGPPRVVHTHALVE